MIWNSIQCSISQFINVCKFAYKLRPQTTWISTQRENDGLGKYPIQVNVAFETDLDMGSGGRKEGRGRSSKMEPAGKVGQAGRACATSTVAKTAKGKKTDLQ